MEYGGQVNLINLYNPRPPYCIRPFSQKPVVIRVQCAFANTWSHLIWKTHAGLCNQCKIRYNKPNCKERCSIANYQLLFATLSYLFIEYHLLT